MEPIYRKCIFCNNTVENFLEHHCPELTRICQLDLEHTDLLNKKTSADRVTNWNFCRTVVTERELLHTHLCEVFAKSVKQNLRNGPTTDRLQTTSLNVKDFLKTVSRRKFLPVKYINPCAKIL